MVRDIYNEEGEYIGYEDDGYELTQSFAVNSGDVEKVTNIANECTELIDSGVEIISDSPEYYYTKLDELKTAAYRGSDAERKGKDRYYGTERRMPDGGTAHCESGCISDYRRLFQH